MKIAKLFKNGQSQAVRLPKDFRLPGDEVFVKKFGEVIILIPTQNPWKPLLESLNEFSNDFMATRDQPKHQDREDMFS